MGTHTQTIKELPFDCDHGKKVNDTDHLQREGVRECERERERERERKRELWCYDEDIRLEFLQSSLHVNVRAALALQLIVAPEKKIPGISSSR